jgi:hypothetical protein
MTDILHKLDVCARVCRQHRDPFAAVFMEDTAKLFDEAAAEIERLRTALKNLLPLAHAGYGEYPTKEFGDILKAVEDIIDEQKARPE